MSVLRTLLAVLIALPLPGQAHENTPAADFAKCAGRYSAELEHAWLIQDEHQDELERRRLTFIDLLNASTPPDQRGHVLNLRIEAKVAHASLLTQATFSQDRNRADWAVCRARYEIAHCRSFLLES